MYHAPLGDAALHGTCIEPNIPYLWRYYLLSPGKEQLAVYDGYQRSYIPLFGGNVYTDELTGLPVQENVSRAVYFHAAEYNVYGPAGIAYSFKPQATTIRDWKTCYYFLDNVGNVRSIAEQQTGGVVVHNYLYSAFGELIGGNNVAEYSRILYIGKELDRESGEYALGIRLYNAGTGLFTSGDPLWGAQLGNSAYHYGYNSPLLFSDPTGLLADDIGDGSGFKSLMQLRLPFGFWRARNYRPLSQDELNSPFFSIEDIMTKFYYGPRTGTGGGGGGSDKETISVTIRETEDDPGIKIEIHPQVLAMMRGEVAPRTFGGGLEPTDLLFDIMPSNLSRKTIIGFFAAGFAKAVSSKVAAKMATKEVAKLISGQKQARHLAGTAKKGGGYLNNLNDAQSVLDAVHSGKATYLGTSKQGHLVYRFDEVIGTNVNLAKGIIGQPTNIFMIKGTKYPSVVPTNPFWKQ